MRWPRRRNGIHAFFLLSIALVPALTPAQTPPGYEMVVLRTTDAGLSPANINNQSQVVWSEAYPPTTNNVFLWDDGEIVQITDDTFYDGRPVINNSGTIAWIRGAWSPPWEVAIYQDGVISTIPDAPTVEISVALNDNGWMV